jgi:hypothetical protein
MSILLDSILHSAVNPALLELPRAMESDAARVMLLAIGLQESRFQYRFQKIAGRPYEKGPARGFWQFERGGGVRGVMNHQFTRVQAEFACKRHGIPFDDVVIHDKIETDDVLAATFARLLLWADHRPLPLVNATHDAAWDCYIRNWRPGKPHRDTWDAFHDQARSQVMTWRGPS